jgi:hypothetical protein
MRILVMIQFSAVRKARQSKELPHQDVRILAKKGKGVKPAIFPLGGLVCSLS